MYFKFTQANPFAYFKQSNKPDDEAKAKENYSVPALGTVPIDALDRSKIAFEVLNGSGVKGAAAAAAQKLSERGYAVVQIGNASSKVNKTELYLLDSVGEFRDQVLSDLNYMFGEATLAGVLTDSTTTASARLVIGTK